VGRPVRRFELRVRDRRTDRVRVRIAMSDDHNSPSLMPSQQLTRRKNCAAT
jgi:hypothetical protein